eukprot:TRINITY_DN1861_c0_g1_i15.p1 TRINITY_DN1861_c0_g1~~TRINITY_DN1861_c0_g1_i15.p1  ORF type:complete len:449 (-),score=113.66 TRINITY_DN1861_c0_g1_i15:79-1425(-)
MNTKTTEEGRLRARKEVRIDHQSRALTAVFIAGFPILIIFISRLFSRHRDLHDPQSAEMSNYQTFPWLGIYMYTLALNARKGFTPFLFSILSFVVLFYCMFLTAVLIWNELLFKKSFPNGITDKFYTLVAYFEVLNLLFIRTRSSIKYFPIGIMTILFFWSFYFQVAIYPFAFISLYLATSACATVFCYLIVYFEIPALTWNPNHTYTPSVHKPRQVFFPAFSLNWVHDLPQFWNMFFPLWGRGQFTNNQLALVDNDMGLLNNTLQNANNLNIGSADDEQLMNHLDLQAAAALAGPNANANNNNNNNDGGANAADNRGGANGVEGNRIGGAAAIGGVAASTDLINLMGVERVNGGGGGDGGLLRGGELRESDLEVGGPNEPNSITGTVHRPPNEAGTHHDDNDLRYWRLHNQSSLALNFIYFCHVYTCLLYTSPSPRDGLLSRMPSSA